MQEIFLQKYIFNFYPGDSFIFLIFSGVSKRDSHIKGRSGVTGRLNAAQNEFRWDRKAKNFVEYIISQL